VVVIVTDRNEEAVHRVRAEIRAADAPYVVAGPTVTVPARAQTAGVEPLVSEFRVRAWAEGDGVRVLVFAVTAPNRGEQIASVFVPIDRAPGVEILATENYRAPRLTLAAFRRPIPRVYSVETYRGDVPVRPWTPPTPRR
jgi:hypothetical protein